LAWAFCIYLFLWGWGGGVGQICLPRPSAAASLSGRRQKYIVFVNFLLRVMLIDFPVFKFIIFTFPGGT
jgi:hypothetical protein